MRFRIGFTSSASTTAAANDVRKTAPNSSGRGNFSNWPATRPPMKLPSEIDRYQTPIIRPSTRAGASFETVDMPTGESRKLLPQSLSKDDAVHNIGRAAMLVAALSQGAWDVLDLATQDRIHQPARSQLFKAMPEIFAAAKDAGAHCAYLSGSGSTICALATASVDEIATAMRQAGEAHNTPGETIVTRPSELGAEVIG